MKIFSHTLIILFILMYACTIEACTSSDTQNLPNQNKKHITENVVTDTIKSVLQEFPNFKLVNEKYEIIQSNTLNNKANGLLYVFFFHPDCEDCNAEAKNISANFSKFEDANLLWISIDGHWDKINLFKNKYFEHKKNVAFYAIADLEWQKYFGELTETPTIFIFKNNKFIKKFVLQVPIEELTKF